MRFTPDFLDRLRSMVTISTVVGRRVALKRRGREFTGLCPFHNEKSPSFTVNDDKGFYHCFGCGVHGDAIRFLTEKEGLGYVEAVEKLAGEVGLPLPVLSREQVEIAKKFGSYHEVMEAATQWFEAQFDAPIGQDARGYLRERGLSNTTRKRFRLGFAPDSRDGLKKHLLDHGVAEATLVELGLLIRPDSGTTYDRFRARLIFPITDRRGQVIAFGGRVMPNMTSSLGKDAPKYLNSPETPLFHKGENLYGMDKARHAAHTAGTVLIAEGYMDVIALHQAGYDYAVAPLGTAVTEGQLRLLWQMADEPVFCLDGDAAGQRAMYRAAELSLAHLKPGKSLRFLVLPKGEDPDSLVRGKGSDAFKPLLEQTISLSEALWDRDASGLATATPEKRAAVEHGLMKLCEQIADPTVKSHFRAYFRKRLWPERQKNPNAAKASQRSREVEHYMKAGDQSVWMKRELEMLRILLTSPDLLHDGSVEEALGRLHFVNAGHEALRQAFLVASAESGVIDRPTLRATLPQVAPDQNVEKLLSLLDNADNFAPATEAVNGVVSLQQWQLLVAEYDLSALKAECAALELRLAEGIDEDGYNHLVALKKQISDRQIETARLQQLNAQAAS